MPEIARRRTIKKTEKDSSEKDKRLDQKVHQIIEIIKNDRFIKINLWRVLRNKEVIEHLFKNNAESLKKVLDETHKKHFKEDGSSKKYQSSMFMLLAFIEGYISKHEDVKNQIKDDWELNKHLFAEFAQTGQILPGEVIYDLFDSHNMPMSENENSLASTLSLFKRTAIVLGFDNVTLGVKDNKKEDKMAVTIGDNTYKMGISGSSPKGSVKWLNRYLDEYIRKHAQDEDVSSFLKIAEATKFFTNHHNQYGSSQAFYDRYKKGELTYMTSGCNTPPHAVGIAIQGDYLIYCNRGHGLLDVNQGTKIYKLKKQLDLETIRKINGAFYTSNSTIQDLHNVLNNVVELNNPIVSLPSKGQEHGNCAFANPKAATRAMLVLLQNNGGDEENIKRIVNSPDKAYEKSYKDFTKHIRDTNVDELIAAANAPNTPEAEQILFKLIKECLFRGSLANTRTEVKTKDNEERLLKLWDGLPDKMKNELAKDKETELFIGHLSDEENVKFHVLTNQTDNIAAMARFNNIDTDKVFEYAIKWNRIDMLKSLLNSDLEAVTVNPGNNIITARLICGKEFIEDYVNKIDSERGILNLLNKIDINWVRDNDRVAEVDKLMSLVRANEHGKSDNVERLIGIVLKLINQENKPSNTAEGTAQSIPRIKEMYNIERNTVFAKRDILPSIRRNAQQNIENPVRQRQITVLQSMVNETAAASSYVRGQHNFQLYCTLRYMIEDIKRENNKLPSAMEKVCNLLISRMEKDPTIMKEIKEEYAYRCGQARITPLPDNNIKNIQGEHLKQVAGETLVGIVQYIKNGKKPRTPTETSTNRKKLD
ncbi:hypothetical protein [Candidatus Berkiella aquae]|uniref:Uncharacterized protein n=1 Tax=Candidatus Berkiella aquae TaxID=295108 RepID=A0A0Q9YL04_9GAMM|nr:hypothetical protein [Candidatus Berkiella aquae]MCS5710950.1 hypothetical protein [Candidatus Berkiella aquae]